MNDVQRLVHLIGATGQSRTATFEGRDHLVVPVVALIGDNVIHAVNAPSAEFVPASILSAAGWNGRPLMLGHPTENGRQISANDPLVMERQGFGFMAQSRMNGKRLGTEAWIDVAKLEKLGQTKLLEDVRAGKNIEVSVGAFVQTRDKVGMHEGKQYHAEWASIAPDHLAFLPDSLGACSVKMGCGANRAAMRVMQGSDTLEVLRDIPPSERDTMDASDFAGPDQSFPIKTQADVDAAKRLIGKAKNPNAVKAKIISIAKRKGLTIPEAWQSRSAAMSMREIKKRVLALFDTPEQAASEEAAELIAYKSMRTMVDAAGAQWDEVSGLVDDLISDEEDDPTETARAEDAEEEVEDARCDAIRMLCYSMISSLQNVVSVTYKLQQPEPTPVSDPRYAEQFRAAYGKSISAANMKTIQSAHDSAHAMHTHTVALGAQCNGMKLLEEAAPGDPSIRAACGCGGESDMTTTERAAALKVITELKDAKYTEDEIKGLGMLSDKAIGTLHTLAGKTPADAIIQAKYASDAALAGHAHGLNAMDIAEKAKKDAADKAKDVKAAEGDSEALKAAKAAGFATVDDHERDVFYKKNPEIKGLVDGAKAKASERKEELVKALSGGPLTDEQLKTKGLDELETLAKFAKVEQVDYSVSRALPHTLEGDVYANPPDPYAPGLAARKAAK